MKKRITIVFDEDDPVYKLFLKYIKSNCLTLTGAIKYAIIKLINYNEL